MAAEPPAAGRPGRVAFRAVAALAAALGAVVGGCGGDDDRARSAPRTLPSAAQVGADLAGGPVLRGPAGAPFSLRYTRRWKPEPARGRRSDLGAPVLAALRRTDGTGVITIAAGAPVRGGIAALRERLPDELADRFADFRLVGIRRVQVGAGPALYTSWVREKSGQVHTHLVVPEGNRRSFAVDGTIRGDAREAAQEVGLILRTFAIAGR